MEGQKTYFDSSHFTHKWVNDGKTVKMRNYRRVILTMACVSATLYRFLLACPMAGMKERQGVGKWGAEAGSNFRAGDSPRFRSGR